MYIISMSFFPLGRTKSLPPRALLELNKFGSACLFDLVDDIYELVDSCFFEHPSVSLLSL